MYSTEEIILRYNNISKLLMSHYRTRFSSIHLTFPQAVVMFQLEKNGAMRVSELAQHTGSANSTISGIVDRLERDGYVVRVRDVHDRRSILVMLSEQAQGLAQHIKTNMVAYFAALLEGAAPAQIKAVHDGLCVMERLLTEAVDTQAL